MFANKYQPTTFAQLVFQSDIARKKLEKYAAGETTGNILLHGPYGSGKSTVAKVVANEARQEVKFGFDMPVDVINGADFEADQLVRLERTWNISAQPFVYAVFDEFDLIHPSQQAKVRSLMDKYWCRHGLILTTNHLHRVDGAIQSRCEVIEMPSLSGDVLLETCKNILKQEGVLLDDQHVLDAIAHEAGDIRRVLRQLERIAVNVKSRNAA